MIRLCIRWVFARLQSLISRSISECDRGVELEDRLTDAVARTALSRQLSKTDGLKQFSECAGLFDSRRLATG
jgi:hypothetical protein